MYALAMFQTPASWRQQLSASQSTWWYPAWPAAQAARCLPAPSLADMSPCTWQMIQEELADGPPVLNCHAERLLGYRLPGNHEHARGSARSGRQALCAPVCHLRPEAAAGVSARKAEVRGGAAGRKGVSPHPSFQHLHAVLKAYALPSIHRHRSAQLRGILQGAGDITYSIVRPTAFFKSLAGQVTDVLSGKFSSKCRA
jgi:hypothetical protein